MKKLYEFLKNSNNNNRHIIPEISRTKINLCHLQSIVTELGGYNVVCKKKKWASVAKMFGLADRGNNYMMKRFFEIYLRDFNLNHCETLKI